MYALDVTSNNAPLTLARLGLSHGYRIDGDAAALNAEIDFAVDREDALPSLALQLWACQEPYRGGALSGVKVAETRVQPPAAPHSVWHDATAFARPPAAAGDYAMVLVLAAQEGDHQQVVDFANYPRRERFVVPHLSGSAGYQRDEQQVSLRVARVWNPRDAQNLSGSLTLQLWAQAEPYAGGEPRGTLLASAELGQLSGQAGLDAIEQRSELRVPAADERHVALLLCEWTAEGYLVRDYCSFAEPYAGPTRAAVPTKVAATAQPATSVAAAQPAVAEAAAKPAVAEAAKPAVAEAAKPAVAEAAKPAVAEAAKPVVAEAAKPVVAEAAKPAVAEAAKPAIATVAAAKPAASSARPSINQVSEAELMKLTGLPKKAVAELIRARPFQRFEQLVEVRGIGEKTAQRLRGLFTL